MKGTRRLFIFLVLSILLITFTFYVYQICYTPNILVGKESQLLIIPNNATFETVQTLMHDGGYVQDLMSFSFLARLMEYDRKVKPGRYLLHGNMSNLEVIRFLRLGKQEPVTITFNNVRILPELARKITRTIGMRPEELEAELVRFAMSNPYGFTKDNILAMFIPNTYEVYYNITPSQLIERMHSEYELFWTEEKRKKAVSAGLSPIEVSILASIVQAETVKRDEAPVIAGLYINRLRKGIPLQADPTLVFAVGDFTLKRVLNEHKQVDSPYNTYKHKGLPPGPINLPEISFIDAVLHFKASNYIYMCAREDFSGYHHFASSLAEHNRNAQRYQQALTREQRKARTQSRK